MLCSYCMALHHIGMSAGKVWQAPTNKPVKTKIHLWASATSFGEPIPCQANQFCVKARDSETVWTRVGVDGLSPVIFLETLKTFSKTIRNSKKSSPCWSGQSRPSEKIEIHRLRSKIFASTLNSIHKVVINKLKNRLIRIQYIMLQFNYEFIIHIIKAIEMQFQQCISIVIWQQWTEITVAIFQCSSS